MRFKSYIYATVGLIGILGACSFIPRYKSHNTIEESPKEIIYSQKSTEKKCNFYVVVPKNGKSPIAVDPDCIVRSSKDLEKRIKREIKKVNKERNKKHKTESYVKYDYNKQLIKSYIIREARKHNVDEYLALAITDAESDFNPKSLSRVGAAGISQFMPWTGKTNGLRVPNYGTERISWGGKMIKASKCRRGLEENCNFDPNIDERFNPEKSAQAQMRFLNSIIRHLRNRGIEPTVENIAAAYNAGPNVNYKHLPRETRKFQKEVYNYYLRYKN